MARLPQPGGDEGQWGDVLNDFLSQVHNADGTLKDGSVSSNVLADSSVDITALGGAGVLDGQIIVADSGSSSGYSWAAGSSVGVSDHGGLSGLTDDDHPQYHNDARGDARYYTKADTNSLLAGKADSVHTHTGTYEPLKGTDDNYVTDAERAALHGHANKTALDLVSGTNTGDQTLPTWSTIAGKPAVIAEGATATDARTAIGAGTSSFDGTYSALSGKPTLGTAAATDSTAYATAAQGSLADTSVQPARAVTAGTGLTGGGSLAADRTLSVDFGTTAGKVTEGNDARLSESRAQTINAQTGTTYTLQASDAGKLVTLTNAAAITLNAPGSVFTAGQRVDFAVLGAGMATIVGTAGATVSGTPGLVTHAQYSAVSIIWLSATSALAVGDLV